MKADTEVLCTVRHIFWLLQNFWATCAVRAGYLQFCFLGQTPIMEFLSGL